MEQRGRREYPAEGPKFVDDSTYARDDYYWQSRRDNNKYYADSDSKYDDSSDDYNRRGSYDNTKYDSVDYYQERPKTISLIEDSIEPLWEAVDLRNSYK